MENKKETYKVWVSTIEGETKEIEVENSSLQSKWGGDIRFLSSSLLPKVCYQPLGECDCDPNEKDVIRIKLK